MVKLWSLEGRHTPTTLEGRHMPTKAIAWDKMLGNFKIVVCSVGFLPLSASSYKKDPPRKPSRRDRKAHSSSKGGTLFSLSL